MDTLGVKLMVSAEMSLQLVGLRPSLKRLAFYESIDHQQRDEEVRKVESEECRPLLNRFGPKGTYSPGETTISLTVQMNENI